MSYLAMVQLNCNISSYGLAFKANLSNNFFWYYYKSFKNTNLNRNSQYWCNLSVSNMATNFGEKLQIYHIRTVVLVIVNVLNSILFFLECLVESALKVSLTLLSLEDISECKSGTIVFKFPPLLLFSPFLTPSTFLASRQFCAKNAASKTPFKL